MRNIAALARAVGGPCVASVVHQGSAMATSLSYVPVDARTQPTGRFELSETLPAMPAAGGTRWRQRTATLAGAGIALACLTGVAVQSLARSTPRDAMPPKSPHADTAGADIARGHAAVIILASAPVRSAALDLALGERHASLGALLAARGDHPRAVAELTAALLAIDRVQARVSNGREASLARARVDGTLGTISALRGQRDRAYLYMRAGVTITEQLLASDRGDAEVRALDRELRAALARL